MLRNPAYAGPCRLRQDPGHPRPAGPEPGRTPARTRPRPGLGQDRGPAPRGVDRDRRPGHRVRGHLRPRGPAAGRQQAVRLPQQQNPVPAAGPGRLLGLRLRLLPRPYDHHGGQQDLLLPVPRQRRLPLRRRPGLRQQAGPRRLPRRRRLGPHHRPARRPGPDPRRDRPPAGPRPAPPTPSPGSANSSSSRWPRPPRRSPR